MEVACSWGYRAAFSLPSIRSVRGQPRNEFVGRAEYEALARDDVLDSAKQLSLIGPGIAMQFQYVASGAGKSGD